MSAPSDAEHQIDNESVQRTYSLPRGDSITVRGIITDDLTTRRRLVLKECLPATRHRILQNIARELNKNSECACWTRILLSDEPVGSKVTVRVLLKKKYASLVDSISVASEDDINFELFFHCPRRPRQTVATTGISIGQIRGSRYPKSRLIRRRF